MQRIWNSAYYMLTQKAGLPIDSPKEVVVQHYLSRARKRDSDAQCAMGLLCCLGIGTEEVPDQTPNGVQVQDLSYIADDGTVLYAIGDDYLDVIGKHQNFVKAAEWYMAAAEQKNGWGLMLLGDCYYSAEGVPKDFRKARLCYLTAAQLGVPQAFRRVGDMYYFGEDVGKSYATAVEWFRKGAEQEDRDALYRLGECYLYGEGAKRDEELAYTYYRKAALLGSGAGLYRYGDCHYYGYGAEQSYKVAAELYKKAAEREDIWGQCALGICYYTGEGVAIDQKKAMEYYEKASKRGCFDATWRLGDGYRDGIGVNRDLRRAKALYRRAIDQCKNTEATGWRTARQRLGELILFFETSCSDTETEEAILYLQEAADAGDELALYNLGICFAEGIGVEPDKDAAAQKFLKFVREHGDAARWLYGKRADSLVGCDEQDPDMEGDYLNSYLSLVSNAVKWLRENLGMGECENNDQ